MLNKVLSAILLCAFVVPLGDAQSCKTHTRKFHNPWSWIKPTCDDGYQDYRNHWYKNGKIWLGFAIIAASSAADGYTTSQRPSYLVESNKFLGGHPDNGTIIAASSVEFAVGAVGHFLLWKWVVEENNDQLDRQLGYWTAPAIAVLIPGRNAIHNYKLESK